ncbi:MAG: UvrB/UvrC motif-containing protein [Planctomycetes bacterium]|nr:UvrB/UvrC motif-containing protein [Planctomycetota bacterium]
MQYCSACQTAIASVVILDLNQGAVTGSQHLCPACAEQLGVAQPKTPTKFSAEILEDLLGGLKSSGQTARQRTEACPGCGMTPQDFRAKGRLGCPRCYDTFRADLLPLLQRIHEAQSHRGRLPGRIAEAPPPVDDRNLAALRKKLEDAVRGERYEDAARLRDELRRLERGEETRS